MVKPPRLGGSARDAGADAALLNRPGARRPDRRADIRGGHVPATDIVQEPVVGLADHRIDRSHVLASRMLPSPAHHRLDRGAHGERAGEDDGHLENCSVHHPGGFFLKRGAALLGLGVS
jgi:hypothetical protein